MCLIAFAWDKHPKYKLILAANRDEFYQRPTTGAHWWPDEKGLLAGKDLQAGGTWMGMSRDGKFSAITNFRDPKDIRPEAPSRGHLVTHYLTNGQKPGEYLTRLTEKAHAYNGFNLLAGDFEHLWYFSNKGQAPQTLEPGLYGLSNHLLDTPWPKVVKAKERLGTYLEERKEVDPHQILQLLIDPSLAPDEELPETGVGQELERRLSAMFIKMQGYGTRASSVLLVDRQGKVNFLEKQFAPEGQNHFTFRAGLK